MLQNPTKSRPIITDPIPHICNLVNFLLNTRKEIRAVNKTIKPFNI